MVRIPIGHDLCNTYVIQCSSRIDRDGVIKVADFGLTEDMYGTNYFRRRHSVTGREDRLPIKWMAPESIEKDIFTEATDVVSTGIFTLRLTYALLLFSGLLE